MCDRPHVDIWRINYGLLFQRSQSLIEGDEGDWGKAGQICIHEYALEYVKYTSGPRCGEGERRKPPDFQLGRRIVRRVFIYV